MHQFTDFAVTVNAFILMITDKFHSSFSNGVSYFLQNTC